MIHKKEGVIRDTGKAFLPSTPPCTSTSWDRLQYPDYSFDKNVNSSSNSSSS